MPGRPEKVVIAGCVRDAARFLPRVLKHVERMADLFTDAACIFVENDSRDETKPMLRHWSESKRDVDILTIDGLAQIAPRTQRLEIARNTYIERIRADSRLSSYDLLILLDLDDVSTTPLDMGAFSGAIDFLQTASDHAAIFANSKGIHYDLWALRHGRLCPGDVWEAVWDYVEAHGVADDVAFSHVFGKYRVTFPPSHPPVEVESAFGGLGVYKLSYALRNPNPYQGYKMKVYRDRDQAWRIVRWQRCEHVHFNQGIRALGGRLFIVPNLINFDSSKFPFPPWTWRAMIF